MAFSQFKRRVLIGWLREFQEQSRPMPGTRAICTRLDLDYDQADRIVDELASEGLIEMYMHDGKQFCRVLVAPGQQTVTAAKAGAAPAKPKAANKVQAGGNGVEKTIPVPLTQQGAATPGKPQGGQPATSQSRKDEAVAGAASSARPSEPGTVVVLAEGQHTPPEPPFQAILFERGQKPRISAEIIRAASAWGEPLDQFVTSLINIGFAEHQRVRAQEKTA